MVRIIEDVGGGGERELGERMLWDWFRVLEIPMEQEQWRRLPRNSAYKYEYLGGRAVLSPRPRTIEVELALDGFRKAHSQEFRVRKLREGDWKALAPVMAASFEHMPPFTGLSEEERLAAAKDCLETTRGGGDGRLLKDACFVAHRPRGRDLWGAALITERKSVRREMAPVLAWIFARPPLRRMGMGCALLEAVVKELRAAGYERLESVILLGNDVSTAWHWAMGFTVMRWRDLPRGNLLSERITRGR